MKTNGATWKAYLASWPDGQWYDDCDEAFDGVEAGDDEPSDIAVVTFTCGVVYADHDAREGKDIVAHFRAWLKARTHTSLVCSVPNERVDELAAFLKSINGKVLQ